MKNKRFSVVQVIAGLMAVLSVFVVALSAYYYGSAYQIAYRDSLTSHSTDLSEIADEISNELLLAEQQLVWATTNVNNQTYWFAENAYDQMLERQNLTSSLYGLMMNCDNADSVFLIQRNSSSIIECHTMKEDAFLRLLHIYSGYNTSTPGSPGLFSAVENGVPTHVIINRAIIAFRTDLMTSQTVANAYLTIPLENLLDAPEEGVYALCRSRGDALEICYAAQHFGLEMPVSLSLSQVEQGSVELGGESYIAVARELEYGGLHLVGLFPKRILDEQMSKTLEVWIWLVLVMILVVAATNVIIRRMIRQPLKQIVQGMQQIRRGDYDYRLPHSAASEIQEISVGINDVLDELDKRTQEMTRSQKRLYEQQILYRDSQIRALQSQINPHFLYNTLECVRSIAQCARIPEIPRILRAMTQIYRYSASNTYMGTVETELQCARNYAEIMQIRFGDRFRIDFEVNEDLMNVPMPKMILQPLVENAVNHGLMDMASGGRVLIRCVREADRMTLTVWDNGKGMPEAQLLLLRQQIGEPEPARKQRSIGLHNVNQRVRHWLRNEGLVLSSREGEFFQAQITVTPAENREEEVQ